MLGVIDMSLWTYTQYLRITYKEIDYDSSLSLMFCELLLSNEQ